RIQFKVLTPKFPAPPLLPQPLALQLPPLRRQALDQLPPRLHRHQVSSPPARPRRTLSIPTAFATSPVANTISPAPNSRITSSFTVKPISLPTRSSTSVRFFTNRNSTLTPSPPTKKSSP